MSSDILTPVNYPPMIRGSLRLMLQLKDAFLTCFNLVEEYRDQLLICQHGFARDLVVYQLTQGLAGITRLREDLCAVEAQGQQRMYRNEALRRFLLDRYSLTDGHSYSTSGAGVVSRLDGSDMNRSGTGTAVLSSAIPPPITAPDPIDAALHGGLDNFAGKVDVDSLQVPEEINLATTTTDTGAHLLPVVEFYRSLYFLQMHFQLIMCQAANYAMPVVTRSMTLAERAFSWPTMPSFGLAANSGSMKDRLLEINTEVIQLAQRLLGCLGLVREKIARDKVIESYFFQHSAAQESIRRSLLRNLQAQRVYIDCLESQNDRLAGIAIKLDPNFAKTRDFELMTGPGSTFRPPQDSCKIPDSDINQDNHGSRLPEVMISSTDTGPSGPAPISSQSVPSAHDYSFNKTSSARTVSKQASGARGASVDNLDVQLSVPPLEGSTPKAGETGEKRSSGGGEGQAEPAVQPTVQTAEPELRRSDSSRKPSDQLMQPVESEKKQSADSFGKKQSEPDSQHEDPVQRRSSDSSKQPNDQVVEPNEPDVGSSGRDGRENKPNEQPNEPNQQPNESGVRRSSENDEQQGGLDVQATDMNISASGGGPPAIWIQQGTVSSSGPETTRRMDRRPLADVELTRRLEPARGNARAVEELLIGIDSVASGIGRSGADSGEHIPTPSFLNTEHYVTSIADDVMGSTPQEMGMKLSTTPKNNLLLSRSQGLNGTPNLRTPSTKFSQADLMTPTISIDQRAITVNSPNSIVTPRNSATPSSLLASGGKEPPHGMNQDAHNAYYESRKRFKDGEQTSLARSTDEHSADVPDTDITDNTFSGLTPRMKRNSARGRQEQPALVCQPNLIDPSTAAPRTFDTNVNASDLTLPKIFPRNRHYLTNKNSPPPRSSSTSAIRSSGGSKVVVQSSPRIYYAKQHHIKSTHEKEQWATSGPSSPGYKQPVQLVGTKECGGTCVPDWISRRGLKENKPEDLLEEPKRSAFNKAMMTHRLRLVETILQADEERLEDLIALLLKD